MNARSWSPATSAVTDMAKCRQHPPARPRRRRCPRPRRPCCRRPGHGRDSARPAAVGRRRSRRRANTQGFVIELQRLAPRRAHCLTPPGSARGPARRAQGHEHLGRRPHGNTRATARAQRRKAAVPAAVHTRVRARCGAAGAAAASGRTTSSSGGCRRRRAGGGGGAALESAWGRIVQVRAAVTVNGKLRRRVVRAHLHAHHRVQVNLAARLARLVLAPCCVVAEAGAAQDVEAPLDGAARTAQAEAPPASASRSLVAPPPPSMALNVPSALVLLRAGVPTGGAGDAAGIRPRRRLCRTATAVACAAYAARAAARAARAAEARRRETYTSARVELALTGTPQDDALPPFLSTHPVTSAPSAMPLALLPLLLRTLPPPPPPPPLPPHPPCHWPSGDIFAYVPPVLSLRAHLRADHGWRRTVRRRHAPRARRAARRRAPSLGRPGASLEEHRRTVLRRVRTLGDPGAAPTSGGGTGGACARPAHAAPVSAPARAPPPAPARPPRLRRQRLRLRLRLHQRAHQRQRDAPQPRHQPRLRPALTPHEMVQARGGPEASSVESPEVHRVGPAWALTAPPHHAPPYPHSIHWRPRSRPCWSHSWRGRSTCPDPWGSR